MSMTGEGHHCPSFRVMKKENHRVFFEHTEPPGRDAWRVDKDPPTFHIVIHDPWYEAALQVGDVYILRLERIDG